MGFAGSLGISTFNFETLPVVSRRGIASERVLPVYGGVDFESIAATPAQAPRFDGCFVGRISPQKGVLDLVDESAQKATAALLFRSLGIPPVDVDAGLFKVAPPDPRERISNPEEVARALAGTRYEELLTV